MLVSRKALIKATFRTAIVLFVGAAAMGITYLAGYEPDFDVIAHMWDKNPKLDEKTWLCSYYSDEAAWGITKRCENNTKVCFAVKGLESCFDKLSDRIKEQHAQTPITCSLKIDGFTCKNAEAYCQFDASRNRLFCIPNLSRNE